MEQYIHTLIAADSGFAPEPNPVARFYEEMADSAGYRIVSNKPAHPGLLLVKPSGRFRTMTGRNVFTGETRSVSVPDFDRQQLAEPSEIGPAIAGLEHYTVYASGEWDPSDAPLQLFTTDGKPFIAESYFCGLRCKAQPAPVTTSAWDFAIPTDKKIPKFGSPCGAEPDAGIFSNPWTGSAIIVPGAGCARFWIEFEFGKFVLPRIEDRLDLLSRAVVNLAEECFRTRFVQGCRFE